MTNHLQSLQARRAELLQRIARIDELIMAEIDDVLAGNETSDRQRGMASGKQTAEATPTSGNAARATDSESAGSPATAKKAAKAASSYPNGVRTWSDKILHTLTNAGGRGMSTGDIMKALKNAEGEGGSRVVPATINTTLQAMETKAKTIRAERGATGRKLHYPAANVGGSPSLQPSAAQIAAAPAGNEGGQSPDPSAEQNS